MGSGLHTTLLLIRRELRVSVSTGLNPVQYSFSGEYEMQLALPIGLEYNKSA